MCASQNTPVSRQAVLCDWVWRAGVHTGFCTAPRFQLYSVYVLWFTCSQIFAIFCLCSLVYLLPYFGYILFMFFGLLPPIFLLYSVYALWFTRSQILTIIRLCSLVYLLPDFTYILITFFGLLAPRFQLYFVYALWFTSSQILAIFCL